MHGMRWLRRLQHKARLEDNFQLAEKGLPSKDSQVRLMEMVGSRVGRLHCVFELGARKGSRLWGGGRLLECMAPSRTEKNIC